MKRILISRKDVAGFVPWKNSDGYYVALHPDKRFNSKVYAKDCERITTLSILKRFIELGYSARMIHECKATAPVLIGAENLRVEVLEEAGACEIVVAPSIGKRKIEGVL